MMAGGDDDEDLAVAKWQKIAFQFLICVPKKIIPTDIGGNSCSPSDVDSFVPTEKVHSTETGFGSTWLRVRDGRANDNNGKKMRC